jgi:hypothetical protein
MDVNKLKIQADQAFDRDTARIALKEKIDAQLCVAINGGLFRATPELIAFLSTWPIETVYLQDIHDQPIGLDRVLALAQLSQAYQYAMNSWHEEYTQQQKIRKGRHA